MKCEHPMMRTPRLRLEGGYRPLPTCKREATHETEDDAVNGRIIRLCRIHAAGWVKSNGLVFGFLVEEPRRIEE